MRTIILPGYSPHNKEWAYEVKDNLDLGHEVLVHEWKHWGSPSLSFSLRNEVESILGKIKGDNKINIIAKSVGTRVVMYLTPEISKQIKKVILCGIPTRGKSESAIKIYTNGLSHLSPTQVICFQNTKDPFARFSEIEKFIHSINPKIKMIEKPRSDHHYPYAADFQKFLGP